MTTSTFLHGLLSSTSLTALNAAYEYVTTGGWVTLFFFISARLSSTFSFTVLPLYDSLRWKVYQGPDNYTGWVGRVLASRGANVLASLRGGVT